MSLSFDDDFSDVFEDFDIFRLMRKSHNELNKILERIKSGEMKGDWEIKQIDEPNVKGYSIRGYFGSEGRLQPLEPIEPLRPSKRRPLPEKPFEVGKAALKEMREPLVDIFDEANAVKVYVELPGVEKEDIHLDFREGGVDVKAGNFHKNIELPNAHADMAAVSTTYKNGVLVIVVPKAKGLRKGDAKNLKVV